jgi:4-hydroxybenzoate polyprenyltransferase
VLLNALLYLNIVVSLSAGILSAGLSYYSGITNWFEYACVVSLSTFSIYNLQRIVKLKEARNSPWMLWVGKNKKLIILLTFASTALAAYLILLRIGIDWHWWPLHLLFLLIATFYVVRVGNRNLRELPFLKSFLIGASWVYVLYAFPLLNESLNPKAILVSALFVYVFALTIPFDIRDIALDSPKQRTLPQVFGVKRAKMFAVFLLFASFVLLIVSESDFLPNPLFYGFFGVQLTALLMVNERSGDRFLAGIIDGMIALTGLLFFVI